MQISGLVITFDSSEQASVVEQLQGHQDLSLGELDGNHLPVVACTRDQHHSQAVHDWLLSQPGIAHVDVVYVGEDDSKDSDLPEGES